MSEIAIRVENLGKQYRIGALQGNGAQHNYKSIRDSIANTASLPLRVIRSLAHKNGHVRPASDENFSALSDVSFEVKRGEVVGVIGRNGAGKSTLLKILSRITEPTTGRVEIHGRVGSLLEVGTGFHPELTGRDNVYLNGAILGMKRAEIARQFDEIVAFAEVEKFIDTPVKHYSSGMYLRLAFAVAAHLEPEILLVDEVLAVGDHRFQEKCLGKMRDVANAGRTVLFVSHNMTAVGNLCSSAILLDGGRLACEGKVTPIISRYLFRGDQGSASFSPADFSKDAAACFGLRLVSITLEDELRQHRSHFRTSEDVYVMMDLQIDAPSSDLCIGFDLRTSSTGTVFRTYQNDSDPSCWPPIKMGRNTLVCRIPSALLNSGTYWLSARIGLHRRGWVYRAEDVLKLHMTLDHSASPFWNALDDGSRPGGIAPLLAWHVRS